MVKALTEKKGMVYLAARKLGCEADTIYDRAKTDEDVANAMRKARGEVIDDAETRLFNAMRDDQPWAIQMILKTIGKDRGYFEKQELDTTSKGTLVITEEVVDGPTASIDASPAPDPAPVSP